MAHPLYIHNVIHTKWEVEEKVWGRDEEERRTNEEAQKAE
jgi:hypothetical protein